VVDAFAVLATQVAVIAAATTAPATSMRLSIRLFNCQKELLTMIGHVEQTQDIEPSKCFAGGAGHRDALGRSPDFPWGYRREWRHEGR
jgi:hypothetical protein